MVSARLHMLVHVPDLTRWVEHMQSTHRRGSFDHSQY